MLINVFRKMRSRKEKEPDPIAPPTHIPQSYDEYIKSLANKRNRTAVTSRQSRGMRQSTRLTEPDPLGINNDLPSLRKDNRIIELTITKEEIEAELREIIPPSSNKDYKKWSDELEQFSRNVEDYSDKLIYPNVPLDPELPFYIDTPKKKLKKKARPRLH
jgi:hypothetical protein